MKFSKIRGIVALVVFLSVIVGLVVHTGTGTVSALGWRDIAAICPVGALEVLAGSHALLVHPFVLLVVVLAVGFVIGKAFCSWICPVPHIRDFFHPKKKGERDKPQAASCEPGEPVEAGETNGSFNSTSQASGSCTALPPVGGERDGRHFDSRHFALIGAVVSSFAFGFPVFCLICPVGLTFAVVIGLWNLFSFNEVSWGLVVFPLVIAIEVVFFRKWCTKFCPISALLSLVASHSKTLRPVVDNHVCLRSRGIDCKACVSVCPERVDPHTDVIPECSRCGDCVDACPAKAISISLFASKDDDEGEPNADEQLVAKGA